MTVQTAFEECQRHQIDLSLDWYQLSVSTKSEFADLAKRHKYRDPKNALGRSRGYCFYLALQRKDKQHKASV